MFTPPPYSATRPASRVRSPAGESCVEPLESRIAPATFVLPNGQGPFRLELDANDGHLHILNGASAEIFDQGVAPYDDLFITGGGAADSLTIATSTAGNVSFIGVLSVNIPGPINVAAPVSTGSDLALVSSNAGINYSTSITLGTSAAHFTAARNIIFTSGAALTASSGDIVLLAHQGAGPSGSFTGIGLNNATISTTGAGTILLNGVGGDTGNSDAGISLLGGSIISSTSTLATAGSITLLGTGGTASGSANHGIVINGAGSLVSASSGAIMLTGAGGPGGAAGGNNGVFVNGGGRISGQGSVGAVTVNGIEGGGPNSEGIAILGAGTGIESLGGSGLSLVANNLNLDVNANVTAAAGGTAKILPKTAGTSIDLGGADGAATLGITTAELGRISAATIVIGDANSDAINLSAAISTASNLTLTSSKSISGGLALGVTGNANLTVNGNNGISLTGAVTVPGGTATFAASAIASITVTNSANNFASVSIPSGGGLGVALRDDSGFNLGPTNVTTTLNLQSAGTITQAGVFAGAGELIVNGPGTLVLNAANTYAGPTTISGGTLKLGAANVIPDGAGAGNVSVAFGATLDLGGFSETINGLTGNGTVTNSLASPAALAIGNNNASSSFGGLISGSVAVTKIGTGTLTLSNGGHSYTGATTINGGTFQAGAIGAIPAASSVVINGGTLDLNGFNQTVAGFTLNGGGTLLGGGAKLTSSTDFDLRSGFISASLAGNVGLILTGGLSTTINTPASYTGATEIRDGNLILNGGANTLPITSSLVLGDATNHDGILDLNNNNQEVGGLTKLGAGTSSRVVDSTNDAVIPVFTVHVDSVNTFDGLLGFPGNDGFDLVKTGIGTLALTGTNTYSGTTTINAGALRIGAGGTSGTLGSGPVVDNAALIFARAGTLNVANAISGGGAVTQSGSGVVTLAGNSTYTGATAVNLGTLLVNGSLTGSASVSVAQGATLGGTGTINPPTPTSITGTLAPGGTPGTLATGDVDFLNGSIFSVELNGAANHDQLNVSGTVTLNNVSFQPTGSITSVPGQTITLIDNDGNDAVVGTFAGFVEGANVVVNGVTFKITYAGGSQSNDVILLQPQVETEVTLVSGNLVVTDVAAGGHNDSLRIQPQSSTGQFVISDLNRTLAVTGIPSASLSADLHTVTVPFAAITGTQISVNTLGGDDLLTVDLTQSALALALTFDGGTQGVGGDRLVLAGTSFSAAVFNFTDLLSGSVTLPGSSPISYLNLEALSTSVPTAIITLNYLSTTANTVTITDGGGGKASVISTAGAALSLINPDTTLNLNGGPGADTINFNSLSSFAGVVTIDGKGGVDSVNLGLGLPALGGLVVITEGLSSLPALTLGAGGLDLTATTSGIDLNGGITSTGPVKLNSGGAITTTAGTVATSSVTASAADGIALSLEGGSINTTVTGAGGVLLKAITTPVSIISLVPGAGGADLSSGNFLLTKTNAISTAANLNVGGTFNLNGSDQTVGALTGGGTVTNSAATLSTFTLGQGDAGGTFTGAIQGHLALAKIGAGTQILTGATHNYDGGTSIAAGALQFDAVSPALHNPFTLGGGALLYNLPGPLDVVTAKFTLTKDSTIGVAGANTVKLTGAISGKAGLIKTGTGTLLLDNEDNTFGPGTLKNIGLKIVGGTLAASTDGALGEITNKVQIDNATFAASASFASGRHFYKLGGTANLVAQVPSLMLTNRANLPGDFIATADVTFGYAATVPVPGGVFTQGGITVSIGGKGSLGVLLADANTIDTIALTGADSSTKLVIKGEGLTVRHIVIVNPLPDQIASISSLTLGHGVLLGDGLRDSVPEIDLEGRAGKLQLYDVSANAFLDLGEGLPYNDLADKAKTPDTYNNRPDLSIHQVKGSGVLIDVTGDGSAGGPGGGGLGKVVVDEWLHTPGAMPGTIRTTQSMKSFKLVHGDGFVVFEIDKFHDGTLSIANVGNMIIQNGAWGSSGSEIEGGVSSFDADGFLAGATLSAGRMGKFTIGTEEFAGLLTLTDADAAGIPTFTVNSDFTGTVISASPLQKLKIKGDFMGSLEASFIGSISAYAFVGTGLLGSAIVATAGSLGTFSATVGGVSNFTVVTDHAFKGFNVKLSKLSGAGDVVGIDNVHIQALSIGNISVSLAAASTGAGGVNLIGIRNSDFVTTGIGTTKGTLGSIGNITVTLTGAAGGGAATGIQDSTFDALVAVNEFGNPNASTVNTLGKIAIKISGQDGVSLGLDDVEFSADNIGATTLSVTPGKGGSATATAIDLASFNATGAIGALSISGNATSAMVCGLEISAGANVGAITVKSTTLANGTLKDSAILAGQALDMTGAVDPAKLARATLGAVTLTGSLTNTDLIAGASIGAVTVGGSLTGSLILAGAKLGDDLLFGGSGASLDTFQQTASIAAITVKGNFGSTSIAAGVKPGNGLFGLDAFGDGDTAATNFAGPSSIGPIVLGGSLSTSSASIALHQFAIEAATIKSLKVGPSPALTEFTSPLYLHSSISGTESASDVLIKLV